MKLLSSSGQKDLKEVVSNGAVSLWTKIEIISMNYVLPCMYVCIGEIVTAYQNIHKTKRSKEVKAAMINTSLKLKLDLIHTERHFWSTYCLTWTRTNTIRSVTMTA